MADLSRRTLVQLAAAGAILILRPAGTLADGPARGKEKPPLPPLNAKVAEFARSHVGRPVGDGICITLAVEALQAAGAKVFPFDDPAGEYVWGTPVPDFKDVLPGDILQFRDAEFAGTRIVGRGRRETYRDAFPHHTAVVVATAEDGRLVTICHQNVEREGGDPAEVGHVREATLRMNALQARREGPRLPARPRPTRDRPKSPWIRPRDRAPLLSCRTRNCGPPDVGNLSDPPLPTEDPPLATANPHDRPPER